MRWSRGIRRIKGLIVVFFLLTLATNGARAEEIELRGYGPALKDENVRKALMQAVDWEYLTDSIFDDPNLIVVLYADAEEAEALDNYSMEFNPKLAYDLLQQTEYREHFDLALLYNKAEPRMVLIAEGIADSLWNLNISVTFVEAENEDQFREGKEYLDTEGEDLNALVLCGPCSVSSIGRRGFDLWFGFRGLNIELREQLAQDALRIVAQSLSQLRREIG